MSWAIAGATCSWSATRYDGGDRVIVTGTGKRTALLRPPPGRFDDLVAMLARRSPRVGARA